MKVPKCMSTQHPDNVSFPFFTDSSELSGEDEIKEAYYVFSHLGCDEQMWDYEGKEVDNFVIKKLLTKYRGFFMENKLGKDVFITLRVPNPEVEKAEAKILLETLESIPRSFDAARFFYGDDIAPIFEVILPMATTAESINRIYTYYKEFVSGKQNKVVSDIKVRDWIGKFAPEQINVIPLFEDMEHILNAANTLQEYIKDKNLDYQRVFLARSDPALNYGLLSATVINKIALRRFKDLSEQSGVKIYPIVGAGSSPFRGRFNPENVRNVLNEYAGAHTFTVQSAFKYDYSPDEVKDAITEIKSTKEEEPQKFDEKKIMSIVKKYSSVYRTQVAELAAIINRVSKYIPGRRKRKPHVGLFGYSRGVNGVKLPRAIKFTASMYSIGFPPELLGLNALTEKDYKFAKTIYRHFEDDLRAALKFYNPDSPFVPAEIKIKIKEFFGDFETHKLHRETTSCILKSLAENRTDNLSELVINAASFRKFLG